MKSLLTLLFITLITCKSFSQTDSLHLQEIWTVSGNEYNQDDIHKASWQVGDSCFFIESVNDQLLKYEINMKTGGFKTRLIKTPLFWQSDNKNLLFYIKEIRLFAAISNTDELSPNSPFIIFYNENMDSIKTIFFPTVPYVHPEYHFTFFLGFYPRYISYINGKIIVVGFKGSDQINDNLWLNNFTSTILFIDPTEFTIADTVYSDYKMPHSANKTGLIHEGNHFWAHRVKIIPAQDSSYYVAETNLSGATEFENPGILLRKFDRYNRLIETSKTQFGFSPVYHGVNYIPKEWTNNEIGLFNIHQENDYSFSFFTSANILIKFDPYWTTHQVIGEHFTAKNFKIDYNQPVSFTNNSKFQFAYGFWENTSNGPTGILNFYSGSIQLNHQRFNGNLYQFPKNIFSTDSTITIIYEEKTVNANNDLDIIVKHYRIIEESQKTDFKLVSVSDVPADHGGFVNICWGGLNEDSLAQRGTAITEYRIWKVIPDSLLGKISVKKFNENHNMLKVSSPFPDKIVQYEKSVLPGRFELYNTIITSLSDSSSENPYARFEYLVTAHTNPSGPVFFSNIKSGVSFTNILPDLNDMSVSDIEYEINSKQITFNWKLPADLRFDKLKIEKTGFDWSGELLATNTFYSKDSVFFDRFTGGVIENTYNLIPLDNNGVPSVNSAVINVKLEELTTTNHKIRFYALSNTGFLDYVLLGSDSLASVGFDSGIDVKRKITDSFSIFSSSEKLRQNIVNPSSFEKYDLFLTGNKNDFPVQIYFDTLKWNPDDRYMVRVGSHSYSLTPNFQIPPIPDELTTIQVFHFPKLPNQVSENFEKTGFQLLGNYPNPFNPVTNIHFVLDKPSRVRIEVYDISGRLVAQIGETFFEAGLQYIEFNGKNLTSGIYFYKIWSGNIFKTGKVVLIK